ncbi:MAG: hypothetical protein Q4A63_03975 [Butyricicoccus pullicaecorum]|nr:hypothetical protein [Butyricicoccus pullicaecorum]
MNLLNENWLKELPEQMVTRLNAVNEFAVHRVCKRIKTIGELAEHDISAIKSAVQYAGADMDAIKKQLARAVNGINTDIEHIFDEVENANVEYLNPLYEYRGKTKLVAGAGYIHTLVKAVERRTKGIYRNLSDTHAIGFRVDGKTIPIRHTYINIIDRAIYLAQSGMVDYHTALRTVVNELSKSGLRRVDFESGYTRRLDSQARMNILEGVRQVNAEILAQAGEEFGADGVEISAHALCAPDHINIQGKQFSKKHFDMLQSKLKRPIGTLNCHHFATPIILGVSQPVYTADELLQLRKKSREKIEHEGKVFTRYEASQEQRKRETAIRYAKERRDALMASGDEMGAKAADKRAREMTRKYREFSAAAGLEPKPKRLR